MTLPAYFDAYDLIHFERQDGILTMRLHTDGGPMMWTYARENGTPNLQILSAFEDVAKDPDNGVVILTGTGDVFTGPEVPMRKGGAKGPPKYSGRPWQQVFNDVHRLVNNQMMIPVPMIAAVNGPAVRHCEIAMLCDIVICTPDTVFQDSAHFPGGIVPGDGKQIVFPAVMGLNRARYFMLTGQRLGAEESLSCGMVQEVLPRENLYERAMELAGQIMQQSPAVRQYTRLLLTEKLRKDFSDSLSLGAALEGLGLWADIQGTNEK